MATDTTAKQLKGLSSDLIADLMANSRTRNAYGPKLVEFCNSDEAAINPAEAWPTEFGGKKTTTLYQGFRLAADKADLLYSAEKPDAPLLVKLSDDNVFILHRERVELMMMIEAAENTNGN
jgi:hypothetical protein